MQPTYFGHRYQVHDGLLDITNESDLVTVSWNQFASHDKTMLIGNSDSAPEDREHLRVTLHHNLFDGVGQRAPRVRYRQGARVQQRLSRRQGTPTIARAGASGVESQIYAENNYFEMSTIFGPDGGHRRQEGHAYHGASATAGRKRTLASRWISSRHTTRASIRTLRPTQVGHRVSMARPRKRNRLRQHENGCCAKVAQDGSITRTDSLSGSERGAGRSD